MDSINDLIRASWDSDEDIDTQESDYNDPGSPVKKKGTPGWVDPYAPPRRKASTATKQEKDAYKEFQSSPNFKTLKSDGSLFSLEDYINTDSQMRPYPNEPKPRPIDDIIKDSFFPPEDQKDFNMVEGTPSTPKLLLDALQHNKVFDNIVKATPEIAKPAVKEEEGNLYVEPSLAEQLYIRSATHSGNPYLDKAAQLMIQKMQQDNQLQNQAAWKLKDYEKSMEQIKAQGERTEATVRGAEERQALKDFNGQKKLEVAKLDDWAGKGFLPSTETEKLSKIAEEYNAQTNQNTAKPLIYFIHKYGLSWNPYVKAEVTSNGTAWNIYGHWDPDSQKWVKNEDKYVGQKQFNPKGPGNKKKKTGYGADTE